MSWPSLAGGPGAPGWTVSVFACDATSRQRPRPGRGPAPVTPPGVVFCQAWGKRTGVEGKHPLPLSPGQNVSSAGSCRVKTKTCTLGEREPEAKERVCRLAGPGKRRRGRLSRSSQVPQLGGGRCVCPVAGRGAPRPVPVLLRAALRWGQGTRPSLFLARAPAQCAVGCEGQRREEDMEGWRVEEAPLLPLPLPAPQTDALVYLGKE